MGRTVYVFVLLPHSVHACTRSYRHDLKIYMSDEGRVQMTAASYTKAFLQLDGCVRADGLVAPPDLLVAAPPSRTTHATATARW